MDLNGYETENESMVGNMFEFRVIDKHRTMRVKNDRIAKDRIRDTVILCKQVSNPDCPQEEPFLLTLP